MPKKSDFGDTSGVSSNEGYEYQKLVAAYYLIVEGVREIEYEVDGEDLSLINEDRNRDSIEFIQVKKQRTGSYTLSMFISDVFPQLWTAFIEAVDKHGDKGIYCTLITNVTRSTDLETFMILCEKLRTRGYSLNRFENSKTINRKYNVLKKEKDPNLLYRFLWGLRMNDTFSEDYIRLKIISYLNSCKVREPKQRLKLVISHISETGQGPITRNRIADIIGSDLNPIKATSSKKYEDKELYDILFNLNTTKQKYYPDSTYPDVDATYRDMTIPVEKTANMLLSFLDGDKSLSIADDEKVIIRETINTDLLKAKEEAQTCADFEEKKWLHKKKYTQRLDSLFKTAKEFGIDFKEESS
jgi:hypothetical protein